jgi:GNAT superfamily N-acetyltransferase
MSNTATMARTDSDVHIQFSSSASTWGEIEDYATCIKGTITSSEEGSDDDTLVGKLRLFYLDLGAILETNIRGFDLFDVRSETAPFYSALIDPETGDFRSDLESTLGEYILDLNVLIVDRLEILPEFRGKNIGLECLRLCLQQYARGCGVVALKCFPLQFEDKRMSEPAWRRKMQLGKLSRNRQRSSAKLKKYYGSLGFMVLPGDDIMVAFAG